MKTVIKFKEHYVNITGDRIVFDDFGTVGQVYDGDKLVAVFTTSELIECHLSNEKNAVHKNENS